MNTQAAEKTTTASAPETRKESETPEQYRTRTFFYGEGNVPRVYCNQVTYGDGDTLSVSAVKSKPRETICILLGFKRDLEQVTAQRDELLAALKIALQISATNCSDETVKQGVSAIQDAIANAEQQ